jgi:uncharacterized membrane protein HdeD (DUF308 family)
MNILLAVLGTWLFCDGIFSIAISTRYYPQGQSWLYDHSIRILRVVVGLVIIGCGVIIN